MSHDKPNILVIMTDQQRADTIGALGNSLIKTPAIDSLVEGGTAFKCAYTPAPICSPARVSMMTGLPPHVHRFTDHDWWHWEDEEAPSGAPHDSAYLETAHDAGYQTFWTGKVHHSGRGFLFKGLDELAGGEPQIPESTRKLQSYEEYLADKDYPASQPPSFGMGSEYYMVPQATAAPPEDCRPHWLADQCIDFLERRDKDRPFAMHCHFPGPHPPVCNPFPWALLYRAGEMDPPYRPEDYEDYQSRTNRYQNRYKCKETAALDDIGYRIFKAAYYSNISFIDSQIGRILDALGEERENTLVVFTCDHGELLGDYGCVGKRCMLEPAIRIPMILQWPGRVPAGQRCEAPVSLMDLYETMMDALGEPLGTRSPEGRSMIEIANDPASADDRIVFSQFSSGWCGQYAATDGQWKYAYSAPDDREWLFRLDDSLKDGPNLVDDPRYAEHKERLKAALTARHDPAVDPYSDAVQNGDWKRHETPPEDWAADPTYGFLWQERGPKELQKAVDELGPDYARTVIQTDPPPSLHALHGVRGGQSPFEEEA